MSPVRPLDPPITEKERAEAIALMGSYSKIVEALRFERAMMAKVAADIEPLQKIAPTEAWGKNVCQWAADRIATLVSAGNDLHAALNPLARIGEMECRRRRDRWEAAAGPAEQGRPE